MLKCMNAGMGKECLWIETRSIESLQKLIKNKNCSFCREYRGNGSYGTKVTGAYAMEYSEFGNENLIGLIHTVHFKILNKEKFFVETELSMFTSFSEGYYNCDGFVWNFMGGIKF